MRPSYLVNGALTCYGGSTHERLLKRVKSFVYISVLSGSGFIVNSSTVSYQIIFESHVLKVKNNALNAFLITVKLAGKAILLASL
jgi:hypothetical protein